MEKLQNIVNVRLVTNAIKTLVHKQTFISQNMFNKNLEAVHNIKKVLKLNKPTFLDMWILDLSKTLMYDFHYNCMKEKLN